MVTVNQLRNENEKRKQYTNEPIRQIFRDKKRPLQLKLIPVLTLTILSFFLISCSSETNDVLDKPAEDTTELPDESNKSPSNDDANVLGQAAWGTLIFKQKP